MTSNVPREMVDDLVTDISSFNVGKVELLQPLHLIVKSQDQIERRQRLVEAKQRGRIGRIEHREVATGLWIRCTLEAGKVINRATSQVSEFQEPRGLVEVRENLFLLSDVNRVMLLDRDANIIKEYTHPFFAFLHSISFNKETQRFFVVSSGYDCLIEMDLEGKVCWEWFAWEHGFNPTLDGVYLCRHNKQAEELKANGKNALFVDSAEYKSYGLMTSLRSNHPNSGCYHPANKHVVLVTLGHSGEVIEIDQRNGTWKVVVSGLEAMPHGIQPYQNGWLVTNTLHGEFWILNQDFNVVKKVVTRNLPGKSKEMAEHEWLQAAYPVGDGCFIGLDANRGLIFINLLTWQYCIYPVDESWCVHHLVVQA